MFNLIDHIKQYTQVILITCSQDKIYDIVKDLLNIGLVDILRQNVHIIFTRSKYIYVHLIEDLFICNGLSELIPRHYIFNRFITQY